MTGVFAQTLRDPAALAAIAPEWNALVDRSPPEALFCRSEFLAANLQKRAGDASPLRPHILLLRQGGQLVAGLPFALRRDRLGTAVLEWLGSGTPLYAGLPSLLPVAALAAPLQAEIRRIPLLRKLKVDFVPAGDALADLLRHLGATEFPQQPRFWRDLSDQGLTATVSSRRAKKLAQYRKRFMALGDLRCDSVTDPDELHSLAGWIMEIKREWVLQRQGSESWATDPRTRRYFQDTARALAQSGRAFGSALRLDGQLICANLLYQQGETVFWSKTAHLDRHAALSPGWLAMDHSLQTAAARGARVFDLMIGASYLKETLATASGGTSNFRLTLNPLSFILPRRQQAGS